MKVSGQLHAPAALPPRGNETVDNASFEKAVKIKYLEMQR
jgi:hypothetical protein